MPFDPVVFTKLGIFNESSASLRNSAASQTFSNEAFGTGSRSKCTYSRRSRLSHHSSEIEMNVIRELDIIAARVRLLKIDAAEIDPPHQRAHVLHQREVDDVSR